MSGWLVVVSIDAPFGLVHGFMVDGSWLAVSPSLAGCQMIVNEPMFDYMGWVGRLSRGISCVLGILFLRGCSVLNAMAYRADLSAVGGTLMFPRRAPGRGCPAPS